MFYNGKQKKPEGISIETENLLDQLNNEFIDSERARGYFLASENLVPGVNECRVGILYPFVALGIFYYISESGKELYSAENVKTKQAGVGTVYQSQDRQKEL